MITTLLLVPLLPLLLPTTYAIPTGGRGTPSRPPVFNVLSPAATPLHLTPTEPTLLSEVAMNMWMIPPAVAVLPAVVGTVVGDGVLPAQKTGGPLGNATSARTVARAMMARSIGLDMEMEEDDLDDEINVLQDEPQEVEDEVPEESDTLARRGVASVVRKAKTALQAAITSPSVTCLGSSANDSTISSLFYYGGPGTTVNLCAGARILLTNAVFFYFANQTLQTVGRPVRFLPLLLSCSDKPTNRMATHAQHSSSRVLNSPAQSTAPSTGPTTSPCATSRSTVNAPSSALSTVDSPISRWEATPTAKRSIAFVLSSRSPIP